GRLDHPQPDAVLDRTAGVLAFEFEVELAHAGVQALRAHDRRLGDELAHGGMERHAWNGPAKVRGLWRRRARWRWAGATGARAAATDEAAAAARDPVSGFSGEGWRRAGSGGPWRRASRASSAPAWCRRSAARPVRRRGPSCPVPCGAGRAV